jgi:hypothetical protein
MPSILSQFCGLHAFGVFVPACDQSKLKEHVYETKLHVTHRQLIRSFLSPCTTMQVR